LASPLVIQKPVASEPTIVYLVVSQDAISAALVQDIEANEQPVYFASLVLHGVEVPND